MPFSAFIIKIYNKIPLRVLNLIAPLYHALPQQIKYGKTFCNTLEKLNNYELDQISDNRVEELFTEMIINALTNVPYYRNIADKNGISILDFQSIDDINKFPTITKDEVKANIDNLISDKIKKENLLYVTTSGSTGSPVGFYQDADILMKEWAYVNYVWSRVGYQPDSSRLVLRGKVFRKLKIYKKNWQWDAFKRELSFNIFNMTDDTLPEYCRLIEKYKPEFLHGYPSAIILLCQYIEKILLVINLRQFFL